MTRKQAKKVLEKLAGQKEIGAQGSITAAFFLRTRTFTTRYWPNEKRVNHWYWNLLNDASEPYFNSENPTLMQADRLRQVIESLPE